MQARKQQPQRESRAKAASAAAALAPADMGLQPGGSLGRLFLTRQQLAEKLNVSERFLERAAVEGGGPPFTKLGRAVRYPLDQAEAWADGRTFASTSAASVAAARERGR